MKRRYKSQSYFLDTTPASVPHLVISETIKDILKIAEKELGKKAKDMDVIDVGCGWGEYAFELEKRVKSVTGVEPYKKLYLTAEENRKKRRSKVKFYNKLIENFSTTKKYDLALSLTIVEHMPNAELSNAHIINLLKDGGMMYLTAPNKLWPKEPHYELYFLNWLPLSLANIYLKASGKGSSFEDASYARTYFGMKKLFNPLNCRYYFWLPDSNKAYLGLGSGGRTAFLGNIKRFYNGDCQKKERKEKS